MNAAQFFDAIRNNNPDSVKAGIVANPEWVNLKDQRGSTPLILAAYYDDREIVKLLLDHGARVDETDGTGNTALMGVAFKGYEEMAKLLIAGGADVNAVNAMGATSLIYAITFKHQNLAKILLENGADPSIRDARGQTAADHARIQGLKELLAFLENNTNARG